MDKKMTEMLSIAVVVEGLITYLNEFFVSNSFHWQVLISILIGILVSISFDLDVFSSLGTKSKLPYISNILTGILVSRGSNYLFDVISKIK